MCIHLFLLSPTPQRLQSLSLLLFSTMEDQDINRSSSNQTTAAGAGGEAEKTEPVRSRWTPKPEQILILESIFNSGMVNPPKDETVRIRKLLEKFGSVGDANVFYWFQNRRSRSRRRQRQIQAASLSTGGAHIEPPPPQTRSIPYEISNSPTSFSAVVNNNFVFSTTSTIIGSSSSSTIEMVQNEVFAFTPPICHPEFDQNSSASSLFYPSEINNSDYQSGNFDHFDTFFFFL